MTCLGLTNIIYIVVCLRGVQVSLVRQVDSKGVVLEI
jgi:hypothetical protein